MKFEDLSKAQQITEVKQMYLDIIEDIFEDRKKIDKYLPELPAGSAGADERIKERVAFLEQMSKITKKGEECICEPKELNIDVDYIAPEFEFLIDSAQDAAEKKSY